MCPFADPIAAHRHLQRQPPITPRPDQLEALAAILDALDPGMRRPLVEAPCAWGKSVLIAMLALALVQRGRRVLILAHRHELLEQNTGALLRLDPAADVGICSASLRSDRLDAAIVVGGTATIFRRLQRLGRVDAVLLDEAHLLGPGSTSMLAHDPEVARQPAADRLHRDALSHRLRLADQCRAVRRDRLAHGRRRGDRRRRCWCRWSRRAPRSAASTPSGVAIVARRVPAAAARTGRTDRQRHPRRRRPHPRGRRRGEPAVAAVLRHRRRALRRDQCRAARTRHRPRRHHRRDARPKNAPTPSPASAPASCARWSIATCSPPASTPATST